MFHETDDGDALFLISCRSVTWYPLRAHRYPKITFERGKTDRKILSGTLLRMQKESFAERIHYNTNSWIFNVLDRIQRGVHRVFSTDKGLLLRECLWRLSLLQSSTLFRTQTACLQCSETFLPQAGTSSFTAFYSYQIKAMWLFLSGSTGLTSNAVFPLMFHTVTVSVLIMQCLGIHIAQSIAQPRSSPSE